MRHDSPAGLPPTPRALADRYADRRWQVVWRHDAGAVTYRLSRSGSGSVLFLKVTDAGWYPPLKAEAERLRWAVEHLPVPAVVDVGSDGRVQWLVTEGLAGRDATHPSLGRGPEELVRILARGLRRFHEAPVAACPFDFRLDRALDAARRRLEEGRIQPDRDFHAEFAHLSAREAVERLEGTRPASEGLVVCHGDYCLPNVLVRGGEATGYVDVGELGVADAWWDLAVATWSVTWNLGPGLEETFLEAYGADPDPDRTSFYRLLYDVVS